MSTLLLADPGLFTARANMMAFVELEKVASASDIKMSFCQ
jgi:hypothetical protein